MQPENLDRDREFSLVDSTEEFETQESPEDNDFQPVVTDFEVPQSPDDESFSSDGELDNTETEVGTLTNSSPAEISQNSADDLQQKTPSQQSFRVMRFEDFLNRETN